MPRSLIIAVRRTGSNDHIAALSTKSKFRLAPVTSFANFSTGSPWSKLTIHIKRATPLRSSEELDTFRMESYRAGKPFCEEVAKTNQISACTHPKKCSGEPLPTRVAQERFANAPENPPLRVARLMFVANRRIRPIVRKILLTMPRGHFR